MHVRYYYFGKINNNNNYTIPDSLRFIAEYMKKISLKNHITGIFYYANQEIFHCLEGDKRKIKTALLYLNSNIKLSEDIKFEYIEIKERQFDKWRIRYLKNESEAMKFFFKLRYEKFTPKLLKEHELKHLIEILLSQNHKEKNTVERKKVGYMNRGSYFY